MLFCRRYSHGTIADLKNVKLVVENRAKVKGEKRKEGRVICLFSHTGDQENTGDVVPPFPFLFFFFLLYPRSPLCIQIHFSSIKFSRETALSSPSLRLLGFPFLTNISSTPHNLAPAPNSPDSCPWAVLFFFFFKDGRDWVKIN